MKILDTSGVNYFTGKAEKNPDVDNSIRLRIRFNMKEEDIRDFLYRFWQGNSAFIPNLQIYDNAPILEPRTSVKDILVKNESVDTLGIRYWISDILYARDVVMVEKSPASGIYSVSVICPFFFN